MPRIVAHLVNDSYRPQQAWPGDCYVQWGGKGIVLGRQPYTTAFFEVFPRGGAGSFIRGEGETIEVAEADAFRRYQQELACHEAGGHQWSRTRRLKNGDTSTYTNGGCFCRRCGAFATAMKPIVELGAWRQPLSVEELGFIAMGGLRPHGEDTTDQRRFRHRLALRAKSAGLDLPAPDMAVTPPTNPFEDNAYERACTREAARYYAEHLHDREGDTPENFLAMMDRRFLQRQAIEHGFLEPEPAKASDDPEP